MSEGGLGAHTTWWRGQGVARATLWCGRLLVFLRLSFGLRLRANQGCLRCGHSLEVKSYLIDYNINYKSLSFLDDPSWSYIGNQINVTKILMHVAPGLFLDRLRREPAQVSLCKPNRDCDIRWF
jgi:hypothetical protein